MNNASFMYMVKEADEKLMSSTFIPLLVFTTGVQEEMDVMLVTNKTKHKFK